MIKLIVLLQTIFKLGLGNVAYVAWYRFSLKSGLRKHRFQQRNFVVNGDFFSVAKPRLDYPEEWKSKLLSEADMIIDGRLPYYSYHWEQVGSPPDWSLNPFNDAHYPDVQKHWTELPDFHPGVGDIKNVWEASRFGWVVTLARAYAVTGDEKYRNTLNTWLADWVSKNPLNTGPHWKCGQEASIRLFNLINAAFILIQHTQPTPSMVEFVQASLERIGKNIRYAIAQDNNHGTSEAAGLLVGGWWLQSADLKKSDKGRKYAAQGRRWLENRVKKLIASSGSFSQHSMTYHRVALDTLCFAEFWRKTWNEPSFSEHFYSKARAATDWLYQVTDQVSGDTPNLGSNDGALLLNAHGCDYRDFRPSLQLASKLFFEANWLEDSGHNEPLYWFNQLSKKGIQNPPKKKFSCHGYATIHGDETWALIKWPWYTFRPSHNDALHIDIWHKGKNIICDSGTYSYNPGVDSKIDLKSVHYHNTVSFDNREQMPKLSRFLLANWLRPESEGFHKSQTGQGVSWMGSYIDSFGNRHLREVIKEGHQWIIRDTLSGNFQQAVIGFNLNSDRYSLADGKVVLSDFTIHLPAGLSVKVNESMASLYYQEIHPILRLDIQVSKPGTYETVINLSDPFQP